MEQRNIDFAVTITRDQWDQLGRTAATLPDYGVLHWRSDQPDTIEVCARNDDAPYSYRRVLSRRTPYEQPVAEFVFNYGRPYASLQAPTKDAFYERRAVSGQQEQALERDLQRWVRGKWHQLVSEAGVDLGR